MGPFTGSTHGLSPWPRQRGCPATGGAWSFLPLPDAATFIGSTVVVRRKADDRMGTLEFTNRLHLFYNFQPQKGTE
jgi:hypothetical protein